jgi:hypothetical protein
MRATITRSVGLTVLGLTLVAVPAEAQMFGPRRLGQSLSRRPGPGAIQDLEEVGSLQGNERFLRANRRRTDFVGPDIRELQRFVGMLQGRVAGTMPSVTEGLRRRVDRSESMNEPLPPAAPRGRPYYPRLDISLVAPPPPEDGVVSQRALETLARSPAMSGSSRIWVLMEGQTAILQGEVPSARDRELAEILLTFEPGISAIENELQVNPDLAGSEGTLSALRQEEAPRQAWITLSHGTQSSTPSATRRSY